MKDKLFSISILVMSICVLVVDCSEYSYLNHDASKHLRLQAGLVRLLESKQVWQESRTLSRDCDGICVRRKDLAHMRGMGGLQSVVKIHNGEAWTCVKVCPDMEPIVRDLEVIYFGYQCDSCGDCHR